MKFALQTLPNGESRIVDASGNPPGNGDADRPVFHVLPKLFVPTEMLASPSRAFSGLECENVSLEVSSSLPAGIEPMGGVIIRQPYPNRRYFVGGSSLIRNGWVVPLALDTGAFDVEFRWILEGPGVWQMLRHDEWEVRHVIHITLHPGRGMTYSMDSASWPERGGPAMHFSPVSHLGADNDPEMRSRRKIVRDCELFYQDENGRPSDELAGYFLEERVDITGVPLERAWTIDAFEEEQLHEVQQCAVFAHDNEAHQINGPVEMPAELFVQAVKLVEDIPFERDSDFARSVAGVPGGLERHPAMKLLCEWWESVRPSGEPFRPGSAMPMIRVRDDGQYWWGHHEIPNVPVAEFNRSGRDVARIGNLMLMLFQATQEVARFDTHGMHILLPSGEPYNTIGVGKEEFIAGEYDEAWYCLNALASFRERFPAAWAFINRTGKEYRRARRAEVAQVIALPEGTKSCPNCHGTPVVTKDPTGESNVPFLLKCGDHVTISGHTLDEVLAEWDNDDYFVQMGADPHVVAER